MPAGMSPGSIFTVEIDLGVDPVAVEEEIVVAYPTSNQPIANAYPSAPVYPSHTGAKRW